MGWTRVDDIVIRRMPEIGATAYAVYSVVAMHADRDGRCWPSIGRIAAIAGVGRRTVQRAIERLVDAGLIEVERRRTAAGGCRSNLYRVCPPRAPVSPVTPPGVTSDTGEVSPATPPGVTDDTGEVSLVSQEPDPIESDPSEPEGGARRDDHRDALSWADGKGAIMRLARRIRDAAPYTAVPGDQQDRDRNVTAKVAYLVHAGRISEDELEDALEAVRHRDSRPERPLAYFQSVLGRRLAGRGENLAYLLTTTTVPEWARDARPRPPRPNPRSISA